MKPSYGICVLLCMLTIGFVSSENDQSGVLNQQSKVVSQATETTTAVPLVIDKSTNPEKSSSTAAPVPVTPKSTSETITAAPPETTTPTTTKPTIPTIPTTPKTPTTPITTVKPTTSEPTTVKPTTLNPNVTTIHPTTLSPNVTTTSPNVTTSSPNVTTTAVPPVPHPPGRRFDGLSFLGGIILAVCLMVVGGFLWKFARTCNEGNYRTL